MALFTFTGPATFNEDWSWSFSPTFYGYTLHDFFGGATQIQLTNTADPPWLGSDPLFFADAGSAVTFYRSAAPVTVDPPAGYHEQAATWPLAIRVDNPIPAGYLIAVLMVLNDGGNDPPPATHATATYSDSAGNNTLVWGGVTTIGHNWIKNTISGFIQANHFMWLAKITNPLAAGDTVTLNVGSWNLRWAAARLHPVRGLTNGAEVGPNPPNATVASADDGHANPNHIPLNPVFPIWNGFTTVSGSTYPNPNFPTPPAARTDYHLSIARGVQIHSPGPQFGGTDRLIQAPSGDIILVDGCRIELEILNLDGSSFGLDNITDQVMSVITGIANE